MVVSLSLKLLLSRWINSCCLIVSSAAPSPLLHSQARCSSLAGLQGPRTEFSSTANERWRPAAGNDSDEARIVPPSSHESPSLLYDPVASKFINMLMRNGKKSQAHRVFMESMEIIKRTQIAKAASGSDEKVELNPLVIFHQAIENVKPAIATRTIKRGGKSYHVPSSLTEKRRTFLAFKWIITSARQKRGMGVAKKLAIDFIDSYNHQGFAIKRKQDLHRLADANRAYAHFRW